MKNNPISAKWILLLLCSQIVACSNLPKEVELTRSKTTENEESILFVADPQIHNIYGRGLKQMLGMSDLVSKVAIRRPELNILAPLVLESLIEKSINASNAGAIIVLGDVTNIACSGEYDTYIESVTKHKTNDTPLLMAHGNHDSYLMGTVNHYFPVDSQANWKPTNMESSPLPTDESWWGDTKISSQHFRNWRDGCYKPTNNSSPMNKSRWLAKYMQFLESDGMVSISTPMPSSDESTDIYSLELSAKPGSVLQSRNFKAKGIWHPPKFGEVPTDSYFTGTYRSFIVQSIDIGKTRIVIIDTSVCEKAEGGWKFFFNNAGQNACIGEEQFEIIRQYVSGVPAESKLVIAGHFPLGDLSGKERRKLLSIVSSSNKWVYMSAHSHHATSQLDWNSGSEINIGSTTDWPMEANLVWFNQSQKNPIIKTFKIDQNAIPYVKSNINEASEVCRHLPAAEKLANLNLEDISCSWISPNDISECNATDETSWLLYGAKLKNAVSKIRSRFSSEPKYREAMLKIAASASKAEYDSFDFADLIP